MKMFQKLCRVLAIFALTLPLIDCTTLRNSSAEFAAKPSAILNTEAIFRGRFAVSYRESTKQLRHAYGHFEWREARSIQGKTVSLELLTPLGQTLAIVTTSSNGAMLLQPHRPVQSAPNIEGLMQRNLGFALPIHLLQEWVLPQHGGIPSPQIDGWTFRDISANSARSSGNHIRRIILIREQPYTEVKLVIEP
jgi:outer membrane lipoprotein LolB